ncbi:hypothetical protein D7W79_21165 [Corallococcus exercitus]|nr:hypothetical protein D7W79_21165 [Corallococcus exercitus]
MIPPPCRRRPCRMPARRGMPVSRTMPGRPTVAWRRPSPARRPRASALGRTGPWWTAPTSRCARRAPMARTTRRRRRAATVWTTTATG